MAKNPPFASCKTNSSSLLLLAKHVFSIQVKLLVKAVIQQFLVSGIAIKYIITPKMGFLLLQTLCINRGDERIQQHVHTERITIS